MDLSKHVNYHRICPYNETYGLFVGLLTMLVWSKVPKFWTAKGKNLLLPVLVSVGIGVFRFLSIRVHFYNLPNSYYTCIDIERRTRIIMYILKVSFT